MGLGAILPQPQALSSAHLSLPAGTAAGSVAPLLLLSLATFLSPDGTDNRAVLRAQWRHT